MKILCMDTSGPVCGVCIWADGVILSEFAVQNKLTHSANLMPMVDQALTSAGVSLGDIDRFAVVTGPGSFTGVRIGVSTVKGLAHGCNKPVVAVDALEAMAAGIPEFDGIVCPIQDARAGQVYGAAFRNTIGKAERLMDDTPIAVADFAERLKSMGSRFLFLGDGMPVQRAKLTELLGEAALFAPAQSAYLRPAAAAELAARSAAEMNYLEIMPMYLRAPSAERNKKLMEAARNA